MPRLIPGAGDPPAPAQAPRPPIPLSEAVRVWARIAALSFGGPAGQIAVMHRILVEEKRWIGDARFLHALNYCMLLPGPEAQQLAIYIGWLLHKTRGGLIAGGLFILPGLLAIMALSWLYAAYGGVGAVEALFFGLKAAVIAILLEAVRRIGRRALANNVMRLVAAAAFAAIFFLDVPFPIIVLAAAAIGFAGARLGVSAFAAGGDGHAAAAGGVPDRETALGEDVSEHARPTLGWSLRVAGIFLLLWLGPVAALTAWLGPDDVYSRIAIFFSQMAVVTFGGAYAVLAYVAQQAVETFGWLEPGEMLDGLGMAETTPGPLIMVTQFVGFMGAFRQATGLHPMLAGTLGGLLTTWVTFVPCFLWIFLGAPFVERLRGNRALAAALSTVTAAVVGVILNLGLWFALHTLFGEVRAIETGPLDFDLPVPGSLDVAAALLTAVAIIAVFRLKVGPAWLIPACAAAGLALQFAGAV
jgi:chromate transporter